MQQQLGLVSLLVRDYDEALAFYVGTLGFRLVEDRDMPEQAKRWVVVAPPGTDRAGGAALLLARAVGDAQRARIGDQTGGRVFLFLHTDDIARDHARWQAAGVRFVRAPSAAPYGTVAVFEDLYGNRWDLIQPFAPTPTPTPTAAPATATDTLVVACTTVADTADAMRLAERALDAGLAACVRRHTVASSYRWQGRLQHDDEIELQFKTSSRLLPALQQAVLGAHPYELPAWHVLPVLATSAAYAAWVGEQLQPPSPPPS